MFVKYSGRANGLPSLPAYALTLTIEVNGRVLPAPEPAAGALTLILKHTRLSSYALTLILKYTRVALLGLLAQ
jgi:hypothetical protein